MTTPSASRLVVVDSSGWLEYITEDTKAADFAAYLEGRHSVLVPTIVLHEVFKKLYSDRGATPAHRFATDALRRQVVSLDERLALAAATASLEHRLAMADAIIYATARLHDAEILTTDAHFQGLPGVTLI